MLCKSTSSCHSSRLHTHGKWHTETPCKGRWMPNLSGPSSSVFPLYVTRAHGDKVTAALDGDQNSVTVPSATQDSMAWPQDSAERGFTPALTTEQWKSCTGDGSWHGQDALPWWEMDTHSLSSQRRMGEPYQRDKENPETTGHTGVLAPLRPPRQFLRWGRGGRWGESRKN